MSGATPGPGPGGSASDGDTVEQVLRDYAALRQPDTEPELEALRTAILLEDVFGIALSDAEIGPDLLAGPPAVAALVARLRGAV